MAWIAAARLVLGHPGHSAVMAVGEETAEPVRRMGNRIGARHADVVETLGARVSDEATFLGGEIVRGQKSRSA